VNQGGWDEARTYIAIEDRDKYIDELEAKVEELEEGLRFYAEPNNYNDHRPNSYYVEMSPVVKDTGAIARAVLSPEEEDNG